MTDSLPLPRSAMRPHRPHSADQPRPFHVLPHLLLGALLTSVFVNQLFAATPTRIPSFGPNGTHWPSLKPTPFLYDYSTTRVIDVDCSFSAIRTALAAVTADQANQGVLIRVAPGNLTGDPYNDVLSNLGSTAWLKRVTVAPRDGFGTVTVSGNFSVTKLYSICFAGWDLENVFIKGCSESALAWSTVGYLGAYGTTGVQTNKLEFIEVVLPGNSVQDGDRADAYSNGGGLQGWLFDGCYFGSAYRTYPGPTPPPHVDSIQFGKVNGGTEPANMTFRDTAVWGSNNCGVQTGAINGLIFNNCFLASGSLAKRTFPVPSGAYNEGISACVNGSGQNIEFYDTFVIGDLAINADAVSRPISKVTNSRIYPAPSATYLTPLSGSWIVDSSIENSASVPPAPTTAYLTSIWSKSIADSPPNAPSNANLR